MAVTGTMMNRVRQPRRVLRRLISNTLSEREKGLHVDSDGAMISYLTDSTPSDTLPFITSSLTICSPVKTHLAPRRTAQIAAVSLLEIG